MLYCGHLFNFFDTEYPGSVLGLVAYPFALMPAESNASVLVFCGNQQKPGTQPPTSLLSPQGSPDCSAVKKVVRLLAGGRQLEMTVHLPAVAVHLHVVLERDTAVSLEDLRHHGPFPPPCNISSATGVLPLQANSGVGNSSPLVAPGASRCPFAAVQRDAPSVGPAHSRRTSKYDHCYYLNDALDVMLETSVREGNLSVRVSSAVAGPGSWIALGFYGQWPAMAGADIALGHISANGDSCIRNMYAEQAFGTPDASTSMPLGATSMVYREGRLAMTFTRALDSGHTAIPTGAPANIHKSSVMWAVGDNGGLADCSSTPMYHGSLRGTRVIDWSNPAATFASYRSCA